MSRAFGDTPSNALVAVVQRVSDMEQVHEVASDIVFCVQAVREFRGFMTQHGAG
jgi:hypothetical protein